MAEGAVVDFAVSTVLETLLGPIKRHIGYAFEFRSKVDALSDETRNLKLERESLHESIEVAQRRGKVVKPRFLGWRTEADAAIADAEEVVRKGEETAQKRCSLCLNFKARYRLGKKADQGKEVVVRLRAEKVSLGTDISYLPAPQQIVERPLEGYEAQSRNRILKEVMDALSDPNTTMVGLYGMGGIGKTTLAYQVYHQATNESLFSKRVIAKVTAMPEIRAIQDKIAGFIIGSKLEESSDDDVRASELNLRLNEILKDKKILIILDDIWSFLDLRVKVGIPTDNKDCKILMTSRRLELLYDMGSTKNFPLQVLSEEESMSLFEKKVSVVKYREIAKEILGRCAGFPLSIVTIAGRLKNKNEDLDAWKNVLTELKQLDNQEVRDKVYPILKLSYDGLPGTETKQIFLLCGICSWSTFVLSDLLWYSFGLGLLKNYPTISQARRHLKSLIDILKDYSLLDIDRYTQEARMHDVVREVAISIACREGLAFRNNELTEWPSMGDIIRCTKVSITLNNIQMLNLPENLGCPDVEFLLLFKRRGQINIPNSAFQETKQLKVLHFRGVEFVSMHASLYSHKNLHTLYLEDCKLPNLDAAIGKLENLEILGFRGSDLEVLSSEVGQLTRLKLLDLGLCHKLKSLFSISAVRNLPQLEEIKIKSCDEVEALFVIDDESTQVMEFRSLLKLELEGLPKLECFLDVKTSKSSKTASTTTKLMSLFNEKVALPSLETLKLDSIGNIEMIWSSGASGASGQLNSAVRSLPQLEEIKIKSCKEMEALFVVDEEFRSLRKLELECLPKLKCFLGVITSKSSKTASTTTKLMSLFNEKVGLPSLETLKLDSIGNIEMIWSSGASGASGQLNSLSIRNCDKLQAIFPDSTQQHNFHKLESLHIDACGSLKFLFPLVIAKTLSELKNLKVEECGKLEEIVEAGEESTDSLPFHFFPQLTSLTLRELRELRSLYPFGHTSKWPNLGKLKILGCPKTRGIGLFGSPTGLGQSHVTNQGKAFPNLKKMSLDGKFCKSNLSHAPALKSLELKFFRGKSMLELSESLPNLRELAIEDSHIKQLWEYNKRSSGLDAPISGLPSIRILKLIKVAGLRHVGRGDEDPLLPFLESMELRRCSDLICLAPSPAASFRNLSTLKFHSCHKVTGLINPSTAKTMVNLVRLEILLCRAMEQIVAAEEDDDQSPTECIIVFNKLKTLKLVNLDSLKGFCTSGCYSFNFPCLEHVTIIRCSSMRIFCNGDPITPKLQNINILGRQYWEVDINTTINQLPLFLLKDGFHDLLRLRLSEFPHLVERWGTEDIPPFKHLYELVVDKCAPLLPIAVPSNVLPSLRNLLILVVEKCESTEKIFHLDGMDQENEDRFGILPKLQILTLTELPKLRNVFDEDPLGILGGFQNLSVLEVYNCGNLKHIFTLSVALGLVRLNILIVKGCGRVEVIINKQGEDEKPTADRDDQCTSIFPSLEAVGLEDLPCLKEFCSGVDHVLICPNLKMITAVGCPGMHILGASSTGSSSTERHPTNGIFNNQVKILGLLKLDVQWNSSMDKAWHELIPRSFLHSLEYVKLTGFPADHELFPLDFVQAMPNLKKFLIFDSFYKQIFPRFVHDAGSLKKLTYLELFNLPELCNLIEEEGSQSVLVFQHLEVLKVSKCKRLRRLMTSATASGLVNLEKIVVKDCEDMTEILSSNGGGEEGHEIAFDRLKSLELKGLSCLTNFSSGNDTFSFPLLEVLEVSKCKRLTRLMTSKTVRGLVNLKKIVLKDCEEMTEILSSNGGGEEGDEIVFDRLKSLELKGLSYLTNFSSGNDTFSFPLLEDMIIIECPNMKTFSKNDPGTPNLLAVQIAEIEDEDPWRWEGGLNSTIEKLYTERNPSSTT